MFYRFTPDGRQKYLDLKDIYRGAVFLCGGHPSLAQEPLELFQQPGIVTLAMNNTATVFNPNIWVGADKPSCYSNSILLDPKILKFARLAYAGDHIPTKNGDIRWNQTPNSIFYGVSDKITSKNILESESVLVWWKNVFMIAVQLAHHLGFRKIYLCGTAFAIDSSRDYSFDFQLTEKQKDYNNQTYDAAFSQLVDCLPTFANHGLELISCTSVSKLNEYIEYVPFIQAIETEIANVPPHNFSNVKHSSEFRDA